MEKETLFIAFSTQKGGVGKSAFTILMSSYLHYVLGKGNRRSGLRLSAAQHC